MTSRPSSIQPAKVVTSVERSFALSDVSQKPSGVVALCVIAVRSMCLRLRLRLCTFRWHGGQRCKRKDGTRAFDVPRYAFGCVALCALDAQLALVDVVEVSVIV